MKCINPIGCRAELKENGTNYVCEKCGTIWDKDMVEDEVRQDRMEKMAEWAASPEGQEEYQKCYNKLLKNHKFDAKELRWAPLSRWVEA